MSDDCCPVCGWFKYLCDSLGGCPPNEKRDVAVKKRSRRDKGKPR